MERVLKPYDKEYMRLAMLKHEETFKEQVFELHRLYRIQKLLMRSIGKANISRPNSYHHQGLWNSSSRNGFNPNNNNNNNNTSPAETKLEMKLDLERPAEEFAESNQEEDERNGSVLDESAIELTLGPASYSRSKKPPETPLTSESAGASLSSSSTGSSHINRRNSKAVEEGFRGIVQAPSPSETGINRQKNGSSTSNVDNEQQDILKQQPPWLFQVLSLNMT